MSEQAVTVNQSNGSASSAQIGTAIEISNLRVGYGRGPDVLHDINLSVAAGEFIALLGASGCGKTTLLRSLAGFVPIRSGRIEISGLDVARKPPEQRGMAMMFQSYALWPHMSVAQNIGYGLRLKRVSRSHIASRVDELTQLVGLDGLQQRRVTALSGGQRQRVALARALAIDPPVLLLDEPLSNLDAGIRGTMRHEIRALQIRLGLTAILVTHDREEAMSMADRIVILRDGHIEQIGRPEAVFHRPSTAFVARFMGADNSLSVDSEARQGKVVIKRDGSEAAHLPLANGEDHSGVHSPSPPQGRMIALFRSDAAYLTKPASPAEDVLSLAGRVVQHSYLGKVYRHTIDVDGRSFMADHPNPIHIGEAVDVRIPAAALNLFPAEEASASTGEGAKPNAPPNL